MTTENNPSASKAASSAAPIVAGAQSPQSDKSAAMSVEMKKSWDKLSPEDVKLYETSPDQFFRVLQEKQGVSREAAEKRLFEIKDSCGCSANKAA